MNTDIHSFKILFVEDEQALRENYVTYLKRYFIDVYEAEDGEEAYEIYKEKKPHILIVDINIPKMNGIDLLKKIREEDHTTKAIILSAHSDVSYLLKATELKLTKYLVKPISRQEIKEALELVVQELSNYDVISRQVIQLKEDYSFDIKLQEVFHKTTPITLTNKERAIFLLLSSNIKQTFDYDEIILATWNQHDDNGSIDALKTIIKNLRKKLPKDTIKNVFGIGYKLESV